MSALLDESRKEVLEAVDFVGNVDKAIERGDKLRTELITKMMDMVRKVDLDPNTSKPHQIEAVSGLFVKANDLIKSDEDVKMKRLQLELKRQAEDTNRMVSDSVVSMFKNMGNEFLEQNKESVNKLEQVLESDSIQVLDGELKLEPDDYS